MQPRFLEQRVDNLERTVEGLEGLPARVDGCERQISQLRDETRSEFSAMRAAMDARFDALDHDMRVQYADLNRRIEETRTDMHVLHKELTGRIDETRIQMHVLHEDVVERIKVLGEKWNGPGASRTRGRLKPRKPKRK